MSWWICPSPDSERERQTQAGPRGLGVDDLAASYEYCRTAGCTITSEPMDEAWGDRVFECIDPFGYLWEFSQSIKDWHASAVLAAAQANWFGNRCPRRTRPMKGAGQRKRKTGNELILS